MITDRVRLALGELAVRHRPPSRWPTSRERIGEFRDVMLKPNIREAGAQPVSLDLAAAGRELRRRAQRPVIVTHGERGMYLFELEDEQHIPAIPVAGPIDVVGAGDSAMAGLVAALCAGGTLAESALVGNLPRPLPFSNWERRERPRGRRYLPASRKRACSKSIISSLEAQLWRF